MSELMLAVLRVLADADALTEGEIKGALNRSWSLAPTLRALWYRDLVTRGSDGWTWQITDAGLTTLGLPPRRPVLRLIAGGAA